MELAITESEQVTTRTRSHEPISDTDLLGCRHACGQESEYEGLGIRDSRKSRSKNGNTTESSPLRSRRQKLSVAYDRKK
ncbi:Hypothetical protein NTJ_13676 [Nesidiocoris tenuis]|uniref:Uncharacterized protein n=1 Tax=Nesidiocoris tenuis TaxID=355587 RepID=A0ABN7B903_9HEMI|nr:Hypothetical protein NTJ_13676 [Nesidiocoris tenuis]